jgi:hypothetical protein
MRIILHSELRIQLQHSRTVGNVKLGEVGVFDIPHELVLVIAKDRGVIV